jgi:chromosomal replication initiation ATPase DnaA
VEEQTERRIADTAREVLGAGVLAMTTPRQLLDFARRSHVALTEPREHEPVDKQTERRIASIQHAVARHFELQLAELTGPRRTKRVVLPRQLAMYLCRDLTGASLPAVGRAFGGRHHTTVIHAVDTVRGLLTQDPRLRGVVAGLTVSAHDAADTAEGGR